MDFGQILQVVLSLGVVALALYLSARLARRRLGPGIDEALRVVARQSVSRTQNLVVVEANGHRHLVALTDGGAHTVETWDAPVEAVAPGPRHAAPRSMSLPALALPTLGLPTPSAKVPDRQASGPATPPGPTPARPVLARLGSGRRAKATGPASGRASAPTASHGTAAKHTAPAAAPEGSFAAKLAALQAQTQWAPLGQRK
jgi:hypothetical protein